MKSYIQWLGLWILATFAMIGFSRSVLNYSIGIPVSAMCMLTVTLILYLGTKNRNSSK
jgi:hypothetical protein